MVDFFIQHSFDFDRNIYFFFNVLPWFYEEHIAVYTCMISWLHWIASLHGCTTASCIDIYSNKKLESKYACCFSYSTILDAKNSLQLYYKYFHIYENYENGSKKWWYTITNGPAQMHYAFEVYNVFLEIPMEVVLHCKPVFFC